MWSINRYAYVLIDPVFYESLDHYRPDREPYGALVRQLVPPDWNMSQRGIWFQVSPPVRDLPLQGWKIHVSATAINARELLSAVVPVLVGDGVPFKFVADPTLLRMLVSKRWLRGSASKFVTIYPQSEARFVDLLERLHAATRTLSGPYILSDRRYADSGCIFYRYGSFAKRTTLQINGEQSPYMLSPDGEKVRDVRKAWCVLPEWVEDPVAAPPNGGAPKGEAAPPTLQGGRYQVHRALNFSNAGGVYLATDTTTGVRVAIKEARPLVGVDASGNDAVSSLRREYRILKKIEDADIAPRPIEFFEAQGHGFLVQEYLADATELRRHASANGFTRFTRPTDDHARASAATFTAVFSAVTDVVAALHSHHITFRDLSPNNVMIMPDGRVKLVDFEAACEIGVDDPTPVFTPGFAAADQFAGEFARYESDYFALGALMLLYMAPVQTMIGLDSTALPRFATTVSADYGVPDSIRDLVLGLMSSHANRRPDPTTVAATLRAPTPIKQLQINEPSRLDEDEANSFLATLTDEIVASARYDRLDRIFPGDPKLFVTNPLGLAYGASGVAFAVKQLCGEVPLPLVEWILRQEVPRDAYPPGLVVGTAGIAWALLELGFQERAETLMRDSHDHPLLFESADLFFGVSGWGMANLKMFLETGQSLYANRAHEAGEWLLRTARESDQGLSWPQPEVRHVGLGQGSAGVALFLLYLHQVTRDVRFIDAGRRALEFDLRYGLPFCGALSWPVRDIPGPTIVPYWRWGSAGIGAVAIRYLHVTGDASLQPYLDGIYDDVARKYAAFPGRFFGLAGLGACLLDFADFGRDSERYLESARRVAAGIRLFEVKRTDCRCGFPGFDLWKISCDYGTGGAGIALFFHRLMKRTKQEFMLDELLAEPGEPLDGSARRGAAPVAVK